MVDTSNSTAAPWSQALAVADDLEASARRLAAIDHLTAANRRQRHPAIERRLWQLRAAAFPELCGPGNQPGAWPPDDVDVALVDGLATVAPADLSAAALRSAVVQHGHAYVPGLLPGDRVERLVRDIDRSFDAFDRHASGESASQTSPMFEPFDPGADHPAADELVRQRKRARGAGSLWIADSPYLLHQLVETLDTTGLSSVIAEYLGERPALSVLKCNARRVPLTTLYADWHQDGAFMGEGIRTLNVWIALTRCGRDAPGLDILPKRVPLVPTGTEGAIFSWGAAPAQVHKAAGATPVLRPEFDAGDVLLFDEFFLHRTACEEGMRGERHGIESWFFAPSCYPERAIPLVF
jgi:hypothetical protein